MIHVIKNAKGNLHIWSDESEGGRAVFCNTNELITLFVLRFKVKRQDVVADFINTLIELDEFKIEDNGSWLTYYHKMEEA